MRIPACGRAGATARGRHRVTEGIPSVAVTAQPRAGPSFSGDRLGTLWVASTPEGRRPRLRPPSCLAVVDWPGVVARRSRQLGTCQPQMTTRRCVRGEGDLRTLVAATAEKSGTRGPVGDCAPSASESRGFQELRRIGFHADLAQHRKKALAKRPRLLLRVPDLAHAEAALGAEQHMELEPIRRPVSRPLHTPTDLVVLVPGQVARRMTYQKLTEDLPRRLRR